MMFLRLIVPTLLMTALVAQVGRGAGESKPKPVPQRGEQGLAGEVSDSGEVLAPPGDAAKVEQPQPTGPRRGAATFCQFHVHTRPTKLMPGQTGTLIVTAALRGDAVLPAPVPLDVMSPPQQGVLTFGAPSFRPAAPGRIAKGYLGRPVYDNYAMMEIPVTVSPQAVVGTKQAVSLELEFDLFDGNTAQSIGRFADRAVGAVEIGQALDPAVRGGFTPPVVVPPATDAQPPAGDPDGVAPLATKVVKPAVGGATPAPVTVDDPGTAEPLQEPTTGEGPPLAAEGGVPWTLLAGGGALVVLVLLLAMRRR